ncbi:MAG: YggS family pyridoxal phosphate-dependent enzyme, partial [Candidatus Limisoma sp.]|nr:YggS family pyridoxal phosphate-dependent enzyme [Candidatus Limisoma sp.]
MNIDIKARLESIRSTLADGVTLVAVSKFHPLEALREAYDAGQRDFGESRVQELAA